MIVSENVVVALPPSGDHSEKEGYFVTVVSGQAVLVSSATAIPAGVVVVGENTDGQDSVARENFGGIVEVKVVGTATAEGYGILNADGSVKDDTGSGSRVQVCRFLETAATGALVKAILIRPTSLS